MYVLCAIVVLVAANLDSSERKRRRARAIVPEESVPCAIAEQYYLDEYLVNLRSSQDFEARKSRKGFFTFLVHYGTLFPDMLSRQHLCFSILVQAVPTFTRVKRAILVVVQLHVCMLTAAVALNVLEHDKPNAKYELLTCSGQLTTSTCTSTLPLSLLAAAVGYPAFSFLACRQMRLTCFSSQHHPSSSAFPLNVRKFARIPPKSPFESICCMRNQYERRQVAMLGLRSVAHRVVMMLWRSTQPSAKDLRFYSVFTSWCILLTMIAFNVFTLFYIISYAAFLQEEVVYHWLVWTLTMFFSSVFIFEPMQIMFVEVFWCALIANLAQRWNFGAHALAGTTRFKDVVRTCEQKFIKDIRICAATRIQRWWLAVLDMYRAINEHTAVQPNFQAIKGKTVGAKKYIKERKWCLKVEVQECYDLEQVQLEDLMSPFVKLQCDIGNPTALQTKVMWDAHKKAKFNEVFFIDVKESQALYLSMWSKTPTSDEFIGRGYFDFKSVKLADRDRPQGQELTIPLHDIEHGEHRTRMKKQRGFINIRVKFLDPAAELTVDENSSLDETEWMLPKHRMQFALTKMGGRMPLSKMLGGLGAPMLQPVAVRVPTNALQLDSGSGWAVGRPKPAGSLLSSATASRQGSDHGSPKEANTRRPSATGGSPQPVNSTSVPASQLDNPPGGSANPLPPPSGPPKKEDGVPGRASPMSLNPATGAGNTGSASSPLPGAVDEDDGA